LSNVKFQEKEVVDYITTLEKLLHQLLAGAETQSEKDKKHILFSNLRLQYHPFHTLICNNQHYDTKTDHKIYDHLVLEHQQLTGGL